MKLTKAIEILETEVHLAERQPETGIYDALKLLIEAGKRLEYCRSGEYNPPFELLPGETED